MWTDKNTVEEIERKQSVWFGHRKRMSNTDDREIIANGYQPKKEKGENNKRKIC